MWRRNMAIFVLDRFLRYGYLPKELPPCFQSNDIADNATYVLKATDCINSRSSVPVTYSGFKSEMTRRKFAIPNPYHFCKAASEIVSGETEIIRIFKKSKYSLRAAISGKPLEGETFAMRSYVPSETRTAVEKLYQNNRIEIRLDINSFFDSIYTHTIPWAIHGLTTSKNRRRDLSLLGNRLDNCMQAMNYSQTNGVLIGNDISRVISEIILCTIDSQIQEKFPNISCCRFVDDYYIYAKDANEVQQIIAFIRITLAKYQLSLNENKIQVNESPFLYGKPWLVDIKQSIKLISNDFLSWLISEYKEERDPALLRYGLKVLDARRISHHNCWQVMQSRIINLWVKYPFLADRILPILWNNKEQLKKRELKSAIYTVIDQSLLLGQDLELLWAVWFIKTFDISISQKYAIKVLKSENDLAVIIMIDILASRGLNEKASIMKEYKAILDMLKQEDIDDKGKPDCLPWTAHWMLAYEIERQDSFKCIDETLGIMKSNAFFKKLLKKDIKFYDPLYIYTEDQFQKKSKKEKKVADIDAYIKSSEFQEKIENGDQEATDFLMSMVEEVADAY